MPFAEQWELRAEFARRLSIMYGTEVPAYNTLVDVSRAVNEDVVAAVGTTAERLGSTARVTAERHGAIRVGSPEELAAVARIFGAMGMHPVGFYDLREASTAAVPVVSTAFRPIEAKELARNPFRVFTSMLVPSDRRFFSAELQERLENFLARRTLFAPEVLELADRAETHGGLDTRDRETFLGLAVDAFRLSNEPVDRAWYTELERISSVAADIGGVSTTHINHLTPRVLDIDALYDRMQQLGVAMIDTVQGPPRWSGPDLLLRQTSFRALAEPRMFRERDGSIVSDSLRVRFGEVEARGIAVTPRGRQLYDGLSDEIDLAVRDQASDGAPDRAAIAADVWDRAVPNTEKALAAEDLAYFTFSAVDRPADGRTPSGSVSELVDDGWLRPDPIVYEDFLPRSAAGIFQSNLTSAGIKDMSRDSSALDADWMAGVLSRTLRDPYELYEEARRSSLTRAAEQLGLDRPIRIDSATTTGATRA